MPHRPKKHPHQMLKDRVDALFARGENDADVAAQAQITSIAAVLGVRWDGSDWVPLAERRDEGD
jgi:hypothetical protein